MLEVKVDLNYYGRDDIVNRIANLFIANTGLYGEYDYTYIYHEPKPITGGPELLFGGVVTKYDRMQPVHNLISECLRQDPIQRFDLSAIRVLKENPNHELIVKGPEVVFQLAKQLQFEEKI